MDFVVTFGGAARGCLAFPLPLAGVVDSKGGTDWDNGIPGTKAGTSALNELSLTCPPKSTISLDGWSGRVNCASKPRALIPRVCASGREVFPSVGGTFES